STRAIRGRLPLLNWLGERDARVEAELHAPGSGLPLRRFYEECERSCSSWGERSCANACDHAMFPKQKARPTFSSVLLSAQGELSQQRLKVVCSAEREVLD